MLCSPDRTLLSYGNPLTEQDVKSVIKSNEGIEPLHVIHIS